MATATFELRYLFGCHFADGSEYFQTSDDVSQFDSKRSAFYDLCQHDVDGNSLLAKVVGQDISITRDDIELFQLTGETHHFLVDLRDGHFEIRDIKAKAGAPFYIQIPKPGAILRLVYFRRRRQHTTATYRTQTGELISMEDAGQECEYHIGWRDLNSDGPPVTLILG